MKSKSIVSLVCLFTALVVSSCGDQPAAAGKDTAPAGNSGIETQEESGTEVYDPYQGLEQVNYNGKEFHFAIRNFNLDEQWSDGQTGEVFNDSVYIRNQMVEERYNVKIVPIPVDGEWEDRTKILNLIRGSIFAGDGAFDLIDSYAAIVGDGFADGLYMNLNDIPNLRLDSPWWSELIRKELTVNGRLFAITGDISTSMWEQMQVIYFNKELLAENDFESPYDLVKSGKWTYDAYYSMIKDFGLDVNGDGKMNKYDRYGALYYDTLTFDNLHNSFGLSYTKHNSDGTLSLDLLNDKTVKISELCLGLAFKNNDVFFQNLGVADSRGPARDMFMQGQGLFFLSILDDASIMRNMDSDFGILPYPKENEQQERYFTTSRDARSMVTIPVDAPDPAFSGMITEALCVIGSEKVVPVYYDTVLKGKTTRDEESAEMLDIIRGGLVLDFAGEYGVQTERAGFIIRDCVAFQKDIASYYQKNESLFTNSFEKFLDSYYKD
ncbi:MAG: hypothetical protein MJ175_05835 [Clostridia bacterium]|nr:hypothetical protein [Clostridia bacterium]